MSFFKKKSENKKPRETNEIENSQLKERLADAALGLLSPGEDYGELNRTKVRFGYLFQVEDRGIQAMFKIMTDKTTAYFIVQGSSLSRMNFTEETYKSLVEQTLELHR